MFELDEFDEALAHRSDEFVAHSTCLVVAYWRPFSRNNEAANNAPSLPNEYLREFTPKELALHKRLKHLRDKEFAHADAEAQGLAFSIQEGAAGPIAMPVHRILRTALTREEAETLDQMLYKLAAEIIRDLVELPRRIGVDVGTRPFEDPSDTS